MCVAQLIKCQPASIEFQSFSHSDHSDHSDHSPSVMLTTSCRYDQMTLCLRMSLNTMPLSSPQLNHPNRLVIDATAAAAAADRLAMSDCDYCDSHTDADVPAPDISYEPQCHAENFNETSESTRQSQSLTVSTCSDGRELNYGPGVGFRQLLQLLQLLRFDNVSFKSVLMYLMSILWSISIIHMHYQSIYHATSAYSYCYVDTLNDITPSSDSVSPCPPVSARVSDSVSASVSVSARVSASDSVSALVSDNETVTVPGGDILWEHHSRPRPETHGIVCRRSNEAIIKPSFSSHTHTHTHSVGPSSDFQHTDMHMHADGDQVLKIRKF
jgi:hypothetical protein